MDISDELQDALAEIEDALPSVKNTITLLGAQMPCTPSTEERWSTVEVGPQIEQIKFSVTIRKSIFEAQSWFTGNASILTGSDAVFTGNGLTLEPTPGQRMNRGSQVYRVLKAALDPSQSFYVVNLGSAR